MSTANATNQGNASECCNRDFVKILQFKWIILILNWGATLDGRVKNATFARLIAKLHMVSTATATNPGSASELCNRYVVKILQLGWFFLILIWGATLDGRVSSATLARLIVGTTANAMSQGCASKWCSQDLFLYSATTINIFNSHLRCNTPWKGEKCDSCADGWHLQWLHGKSNCDLDGWAGIAGHLN